MRTLLKWMSIWHPLWGITLEEHCQPSRWWSKCNHFSIAYDEVTTLDNQSWIVIHVYIIEDREIMPLLLNLECVTEDGGASNIMKRILLHLLTKRVDPTSYHRSIHSLWCRWCICFVREEEWCH